ncbi:MAG: hypothetical protein ACRCZK_04630 [Oscillospiraceae bacterium]
MKKIISLFLISTFTFVSLSGCFNKDIDEYGPKNTINILFQNMIDGDIENAKSLILDEKELMIEDAFGLESFKIITKNLKYEIVKETLNEDGKTATVKMKVGNYDLNTILDKATIEATNTLIEYQSGGKELTEEETKNALDKALKNQIENYNGEVLVGEVEVKLEKINDKWLVVFDEKLQQYILGDI